MKIIKSKSKNRIVVIFFIIIILFSGYTWIFNEFFYEMYKNTEKYNNLKRAYDPSLSNYTYIEDVTQSIYEFNAKGECYILADLKGIDFTSFNLDNLQYNLSYGINIFTKDFGNEFTVHTLEFLSSDINNDHFRWVCVEPLFIAVDNITVNLDHPKIIYFEAGGPISILMQPNFSYNWLYLEVDGVIINDIYPTDEYPEIDSVFYSYFIEDGAYIRFDLNTVPKEHVMKVRGNGTIEYKVIVNLDWDEDLVHDVEEVQKEMFIEDLDPTKPNIWGFFEKSSKFSFSIDSNEIRDGSFRFYVPESYEGLKYLYIALFSGTIFDIQIDTDKLTLKDVVLNKNFGSYAYKKPYGKVESGYHTLYYKYYANETTKISFTLDGRDVIIFDKAEFKDTDGDGLKDVEERNSGLDPYSSDTDNDGLSDNLDSSPLYSLTLHASNLYQFVIPHDPIKNTLISMSIKRPSNDYSTFTTPRLYRDDLNISIYFYLRLFGNQSITRTELATFWKGDENNVDSYCLVDGYDCTGVGDALPINENPNAEFIFLNSKFSENTYEFDINFPKNNPAKDDTAIDLRFDFVWIVTCYDSESGNTTILHIYEPEENLMLQSFGYREIGDINYKLASPDSMLENQILWALTQNPNLGSSSHYGVTDDIVGQGTIDFMSLAVNIMEDRNAKPILRETLGNEDIGFIKPDGDVLNNGWTPTPLWENIDEYPDTPSDGYSIAGNGNDLCEFNLSSFEMGENKVVSKITLLIYGKIDGFYSLETYWRIGEGGLSSERTPNLPVQEFPEYPVNYNWASVEWTGLSLPQSALDNLRLRFVTKHYYGAGMVRVGIAVLIITYQDVGAYLENEVLYVAGFQKNFDILNKINLQQNLINPSFETLHFGDYESYFSYYTVSNVYDSNEIEFLNDALRGENKICYSITWKNYTENGIEDYEKRVIIQGLPISMELLSYSTSNVLKITQAIGNEIPIDKIPDSIDSELHDKIIFWNQTYIQLTGIEEGIPTLIYKPLQDIYKEFFDNRPWDVEASKRFFKKYSISGGLDYVRDLMFFAFYVENFQKMISNVPSLQSVYKQLLDIMGETPATLADIQFAHLLNLHRSWDEKVDALDKFTKLIENIDFSELTDDELKIIRNFMDGTEFTLPGSDRIYLKHLDVEDFKKELLLRADDAKFSARRGKEYQNDPLGAVRCWLLKEQNNFRLKAGAIGGALIILGTFLTIYTSIELSQLYYQKEDYAGRETEFWFRILAASCNLAIGISITIYGGLLLTQAITKFSQSIIVSNINELAEKVFTKFSSCFGKLVKVLGILVDLYTFFADLAYALSIWNENPELATQIIVQSVIFSLIPAIYDSIALVSSSVAAAFAYIAMGALVITVIIFALISCFIYEPPPDEYFYPLNIELAMDYSKDQIKKHGGFEIGDELSFDVGLRDTASVLDTYGTFGIKAKFQLRFNYSLYNVDGWGFGVYGRWDERIAISPYSDCGTYFGENSYPAFWPSDADYGFSKLDHGNEPWPSDKDYEYESYNIDKTLTSASSNLNLELKMTKDKYNALINPDSATGYYYMRYVWVEDEIIRINLGFPVLETSINDFYSHTTALPELISFDMLETKLKIALAQYQYKDANQIFTQLQQRDPNYECVIPINTNIATDLKENIIEIDPITGWVETDISLILEGTEFPTVDITLSPPEGFSIDHLSLTQPITSDIAFNLSANNPDELGGIYYFEMEIKRHDTGELIYTEKVPFRIPFVQSFHYSQSNIFFQDTTIYNETLISEILDPPLELLKGQIVNIKCKTTTSNEVLIKFLNNGNLLDVYTVLPRGNDNFGDEFIQILIRKDITFDQFNFSVNLEEGQYFMVYDILLMDSLLKTSDGEWFNPISLTNGGNVIEFVEFSFSGVPFDFVDTSIHSEEFFKQNQLISLMPGEHRDCLFNITNPIDPIDNLYWRGIKSYDPITEEIYLEYVDSLEIEGIHIQNPKNETYNIFGTNMHYEDGIPLEIVSEDDLLWTMYSLDGASNVSFSERTYIPISEFDGIHTIKVYGENYLNEIIASKTKYFTINHAISFLNPINKSITGPSLGYYPATYGFEAGKTGSDLNNWFFDETGGSISVLNKLNDHSMVLQLKDTHSSKKVSIIDSFGLPQTTGIVEFWWLTDVMDSGKNANVRLWQNSVNDGLCFYFQDNSFKFYDGTVHIITSASVNTWYHIKIEFNTDSDKWWVWIDGVKYGGVNGFGYRGSTTAMMNIQFDTWTGIGHSLYLDAIGYSWDMQYAIGDNLQEGILINVVTIINLNDLEYALDDSEPLSTPTSFVIPKLENGIHSLIFYGTDNYGCEWSSEKRYFTIAEDLNPPQLTKIQVSDNPLELGDSQIIKTTIKDISGIRRITAYIQYPDGTTIAELPMKYLGNDKYESTWKYDSSSLGIYYIDIEAIDASFNINILNVDNALVFDLDDTISPTIYNVFVSNDPLDRFDIQTIRCNIEDLSGIQSVTAYIQHPDGTNVASVQMSHIIDDLYETQWDSSSATYGTYYVDIEAIDATPNENLGFINNGVSFSVIEPPPPTIDIIYPYQGATVSGYKTITVAAGSTAGITKVEFRINGVLVHTDTDGSNGWSYYWNTKTVSNGGVTITCKAYDSLGRTVSDTVSVTVQNSSGGGSGCPFLSVYDGEQYYPEGLLDIHNIDGIDIVYYHTLITEPFIVNNRYLLRLTEHYKTISRIDQVLLFGRMTDGRFILLPLLSATHSVFGLVTRFLWFSDDKSVTELGADHTTGMSEYINLEFLAFRHLIFTEFIFVIEGNNYIVK